MWVNVVDCNEARLSTLPRTLIHIGESSVEAQLEVAFSYVYNYVHVCYGCIAVTVQLSAEWHPTSVIPLPLKYPLQNKIEATYALFGACHTIYYIYI